MYSENAQHIEVRQLAIEVLGANNQPVALVEPTISQTFELGVSHIINGESGIGKSLTMNALGGLHNLFKGSIILPARFKNNPIHYVPPTSWLQPEGATLYETLVSSVSDRNEKSLRKEINDLMTKFSLSEKFSNKLDDKQVKPSLGEGKRLMILKAIISRAEIIVIDEGLANLDDVTRKQIIDVLDQYVEGKYQPNQGIKATIFSIQHDTKGNLEEAKLKGVNHLLTKNEGWVRVESDRESAIGASSVAAR